MSRCSCVPALAPGPPLSADVSAGDTAWRPLCAWGFGRGRQSPALLPGTQQVLSWERREPRAGGRDGKAARASGVPSRRVQAVQAMVPAGPSVTARRDRGFLLLCLLVNHPLLSEQVKVKENSVIRHHNKCVLAASVIRRTSVVKLAQSLTRLAATQQALRS